MPLGVSEKEVYLQVSTPCEVGDVFCFYSDGVTEAHNPAGEQFGMERLVAVVRARGWGGPQELVAAIHRAVVAFTQSDKFADDLTCVVVKTGEVNMNVGPNGEKQEFARIETQIPSDLSQLVAVRAFVREFCIRVSTGEPNEDSIAQLQLAVTEAVSNIIRHAYQGRADRMIQIEARSTGEGVAIRLRHDGLPFDPDEVPAPPFDGSRESGLGVYIIENTVDAVQYAQDWSEKNTIHLYKRMRG